MRLLVFFDLPVITPQKRRAAAEFRHFLLKEGFEMIQWSVYCRLCSGVEMAGRCAKRLRENVPSEGSVRLMQITDKQFGRMEFLLGEPGVQEKMAAQGQLILF